MEKITNMHTDYENNFIAEEIYAQGGSQKQVFTTWQQSRENAIKDFPKKAKWKDKNMNFNGATDP